MDVEDPSMSAAEPSMPYRTNANVDFFDDTTLYGDYRGPSITSIRKLTGRNPSLQLIIAL